MYVRCRYVGDSHPIRYLALVSLCLLCVNIWGHRAGSLSPSQLWSVPWIRKAVSAIDSLPFKLYIVIALEMHSSAALSLLVFFREVAVGVGASVERDQSAPVQTAPWLQD